MQGHSTFLAPVDFDLSFTSDRFISPYSGTNDVSLFKSWLASENTEMERGLGGEEANTGLQDREGKVCYIHCVCVCVCVCVCRLMGESVSMCVYVHKCVHVYCEGEG